MSADVKFDNIWVKFGSFVAARDVNIHIQEGEFYTILGPSGCGKVNFIPSSALPAAVRRPCFAVCQVS
jgi:ABC-type Fe3+/spermidine/putrescine transport system ATPase subunit